MLKTRKSSHFLERNDQTKYVQASYLGIILGQSLDSLDLAWSQFRIWISLWIRSFMQKGWGYETEVKKCDDLFKKKQSYKSCDYLFKIALERERVSKNLYLWLFDPTDPPGPNGST